MEKVILGKKMTKKNHLFSLMNKDLKERIDGGGGIRLLLLLCDFKNQIFNIEFALFEKFNIGRL